MTTDFTTDPTPTKHCSKCGATKPATTEYFYRDKKLKSGLHSWCKECVLAGQKAYHHANKDERNKYSKDWRKNNNDRFKVALKDWYEKNKERVKAYWKAKREEDPEKLKQQQRERGQKYRENHKEIANARTSAWEKANPDRGRIKKHRRRARKVSKPDTFTPEQWQHCLNYFKGCCAVCERPLSGLFHRPHADHWIALSDPDSPGTVAKNMICLCGGRDGCNESKADKRPDVWLEAKFGKRRAKQIATKIQAYFDSLA